jgi:hypothetical protein
MTGVHDRGGWPAGPIDRAEHTLADWELLVDGIRGALGGAKIMRTDELRRGIEGIPPDQYESLSYYERWITAIERILIEKGLLSRDEIDCKVAELRG